MDREELTFSMVKEIHPNTVISRDALKGWYDRLERAGGWAAADPIGCDIFAFAKRLTDEYEITKKAIK